MAKLLGLEALRDAHAPSAIGFWQVGAGWYLLIFILLILIVIGLVFWKSHYIYWRQKKIALNTLEKYKLAYQKDNNSQVATSLVNELLKKLAIAFFSRDKVAGLTGMAWLNFLNQTSGRSKLNLLSLEKEFLEYPYQAPKKVDLDLFFKLSMAWIKNLNRKRKDKHV